MPSVESCLSVSFRLRPSMPSLRASVQEQEIVKIYDGLITNVVGWKHHVSLDEVVT